MNLLGQWIASFGRDCVVSMCATDNKAKSRVLRLQVMFLVDGLKGLRTRRNLVRYLGLEPKICQINMTFLRRYLQNIIDVYFLNIFTEMSCITLYLANFWFQSQVAGNKLVPVSSSVVFGGLKGHPHGTIIDASRMQFSKKCLVYPESTLNFG